MLILCLILGLAAYGFSRLSRRLLLLISFWLITLQRRLGLVPNHLQYDLETVIDASPKVVRLVLRYLAIALLLWVAAWLARDYVTLSPFRELLSFLSSSAAALYWGLYAALT